MTSTKKKPTKPEAITQEDCKFIVVIYVRYRRMHKRTPKHTRPNHDFDKIKSIVSEDENSVNSLSIHDFLRLGKFNEHSKKPRPIIVKLNQAIDVSSLLSKAKYLPKHIRIKPDMSPAERHTE